MAVILVDAEKRYKRRALVIVCVFFVCLVSYVVFTASVIYRQEPPAVMSVESPSGPLPDLYLCSKFTTNRFTMSPGASVEARFISGEVVDMTAFSKDYGTSGNSLAKSIVARAAGGKMPQCWHFPTSEITPDGENETDVFVKALQYRPEYEDDYVLIAESRRKNFEPSLSVLGFSYKPRGNESRWMPQYLAISKSIRGTQNVLAQVRREHYKAAVREATASSMVLFKKNLIFFKLSIPPAHVIVFMRQGPLLQVFHMVAGLCGIIAMFAVLFSIVFVAMSPQGPQNTSPQSQELLRALLDELPMSFRPSSRVRSMASVMGVASLELPEHWKHPNPLELSIMGQDTIVETSARSEADNQRQDE